MTSMTKARSRLEARLGPVTIVDAGVAVAALVGSLALALASTGGGNDGLAHPGPLNLGFMSLLVLLLSTLPIVAWRCAPLGVFAVSASATVVLASLHLSLGLPVGLTAALYFLAASRTEVNPWSPTTTAIVVGFLVAYLGATALTDARFPAIELSHATLASVAAYFAGERTRLRLEQLATLRERAARAERDAERDRQLAVAEERARIARDLHDSAGHAVNVIAVRAGAARLWYPREPQRTIGALEAIEELARQTVAEIDHMVGTLRDSGADGARVEMPPGLASVDNLLSQHIASGLDVTLDTAGSPHPIGPAADQAAYRILQEALTNAARHGTGTATVELRFESSGLALTVINPVPAGRASRSGGGHGIVGMHERAALLGGTLAAEASNGGYCVHATIPYGPLR